MIKNNYLIMGTIGLIIMLTLNLFGSLHMDQPAAAPLSSGWYSTWLPS